MSHHRSAGGAALTVQDFLMFHRIGSGDIGDVYLCRLKGSGNDEGDDRYVDQRKWYAMKVMNKDALVAKMKVDGAETERKVLKMLDHPFLPTLYAELEDSRNICFVMEFCSGGDLNVLRHKQPHKRFSLKAARFYAAEVLVALEYLHMLGIVYRDLKPENVLLQADGHIMLTDFDLCLCSDTIPTIESPEASPFSSSFSLFRPCCVGASTDHQRLFVAEPVAARSCSRVGTHEYVAPEMASGGSHGNAVDWWAYGVFLYEMLYGRTPFAADSNQAVLLNIVKKPLAFPTLTASSALGHHARDLITLLLEKDPTRRLGSNRGSAEVKGHPFFKGVNLALIRSSPPPAVAGVVRRQRTATTASTA